MAELKQHHAQIIKLGLSSDNDAVGRVVKFCALSQSGDLNYALKVFDLLPHPDAFIYNTMFRGYLQAQLYRHCITLHAHMLEKSVTPNKFSFPPIIRACSVDDAVEEAKQVHAQVLKLGFAQDSYCQNNLIHIAIEVDPKLATTIIDMYCKCGRLDKAFEIFERLSRKGVSSWNCMIGGFAMHGKGKAAIELLKKMEEETMVKPDYVTFVNVLAACAHSGLVEEGMYYFSYMTRVYGIDPRMEHYGCLVDLLGRAGLLDEAKEVINNMPMKADVGVLGALLGACRIHGNIDMAEGIGRQVIELEPSNSGRYVLLANLYAKAGKWEDVANIRKLMNDRGVNKVAGCSMIELEGSVSEFVAGGRKHPEAKELYRKVEEMLVNIKGLGYVADSDGMLYDICEEETENPLMYHSEKLAIAFGLLKTKAGKTIRVTKNLRVCKDCHEASKLISRAYDREIIVRDRNRFHHFKGGVCSCDDYW
ncbi:hypothetical protein ACS0TY_031801 [Phlomoides rotata]